MQPQQTTRPVMDVAAPRQAVPFTRGPAPQSVPVVPAPALAANTAPNISAAPTPKHAALRQQSANRPEASGAPVAIVTVAVLVMLALAGIAIIVYLTSK